VLANVYSFTGQADGGQPAALVQMPDGSFYGVTQRLPGTVFHLTVSSAGVGTLTTVYTFSTDDPAGYLPNSSLILATDGNLYGVNDEGGDGYGTVYRFDPATGAASGILIFNDAQGSRPIGALVQATNGLLYGTAQFTSGGYGIFYSVSTSGTFNAIYPFNDSAVAEDPLGALVVAPDGTFYGLANQGGTGSYGTVFHCNPTLTTNQCTAAYTFSGSADGGNPSAGLFLSSDGLFYGIADDDNGNSGNVFAFASNGANEGTLTTLFDFNGTDGENPDAGLLQASDGKYYGSTAFGGTNGSSGGVLYRIAESPAPLGPVQLTLSASQIDLGSSVSLNWKAVNAFSATLQQCYAFVQNAAATAGNWTGLQTGTASSSGYSGSAILTPTAIGTYTYALTCGGTESGFATLTVIQPTTTKVSASPNPVQIGQLVAISATVTRNAGTGTPTGSATFYYGSIALETVALNGSGVATLTVPTSALPAGTYPITATYLGDANDGPSASAATGIAVNQDTTATTLAASPNTLTPPTPVTFTATVKRSAVSGSPTGQVTFYFSTTALTTVNLNGSGVATYTVPTSELPAGTYALTAKYSGDATDKASTSNAASVTIQ